MSEIVIGPLEPLASQINESMFLKCLEMVLAWSPSSFLVIG